MAEEHRAPPALIAAMAVFVSAMGLAALGFWVGALVWPGGFRAMIAALGFAVVAVFGALHIPAAIVGILLLQWRRPRLKPLHRVLLEAATLYFALAVLASVFLNYLMVSMFDNRF